jgi:hypothetical protein
MTGGVRVVVVEVVVVLVVVVEVEGAITFLEMVFDALDPCLETPVVMLFEMRKERKQRVIDVEIAVLCERVTKVVVEKGL